MSFRKLALAALALAALVVVPTSAHAKLTPKQVKAAKAAVNRIHNGNWTKADIRLIKSMPSVARYVHDPRPQGTESGGGSGFVKKNQTRDLDTDSGYDDLSVGPESGGCPGNQRKRRAWAWFRAKTILGATMYRYKHTAVWCSGGGDVLGWYNRFDQVLDPDAFTDVRELVTNTRGAVGGSTSWSLMKRHIATEIPVLGTYEHHYPWVKLKIGATSLISYDGDAG